MVIPPARSFATPSSPPAHRAHIFSSILICADFGKSERLVRTFLFYARRTLNGARELASVFVLTFTSKNDAARICE
jgi:hypothetical protein